MLLNFFMMFPANRRLIHPVLLDAELSTKARRVVLLRGVGCELLVVVEAHGGGVLAIGLYAKLSAEALLQVGLRLVGGLLLHDAVLGVDVGAELVETRRGKNWDLEIKRLRNFENHLLNGRRRAPRAGHCLGAPAAVRLADVVLNGQKRVIKDRRSSNSKTPLTTKSGSVSQLSSSSSSPPLDFRASGLTYCALRHIFFFYL
mgnify:CR=1 FL=1